MCNATGNTLVAPPGLGGLLPNPKRTEMAPPKKAAARKAAHVTHVFTSIVQGDMVAFRSLLDSGRVRDVNEIYNGNTAAHHAAYHGNTAMLALLARHGADFSVENKWGETVLDAARSGGQEHAEAFLAQQASPASASASATATPTPTMLPCSVEVQRAVAWVVSHLDGAEASARDAVGAALQGALYARYETHWHTGNPQRGTGFRCLTSTPGNCDRIIEGAVHTALGKGTAATRAALRALPREFSVWCDPGRVAVRVGGFHEDVETVFGAPWAVRSSTPPSPTLHSGSPHLSPKASTFAPTPALGASVWAVAADPGAGTGADCGGGGGGGGWPVSHTSGTTSDVGTGLAQQERQLQQGQEQAQEQLATLWLHHQMMAQQSLMQHVAFHQHQHYYHECHENLDTEHHAQRLVAHQQDQHRHYNHTTRHTTHHTAPKPESRNLAAFVMDALERKAVAA